MDGFSEERRGLFDGLRVPQSFNAVLVAALALLIYILGIWGIEAAAEVPNTGMCRLVGGMLGNCTYRLGAVGEAVAHWGGWDNQRTAYTPMVWVAFILWTTIVWAFFSGAIHRIAAVQIAREEGLELRESIRFAGKKFVQNFFSIAFVFMIVGFFYLVTNATVAGWLGRIPYVGDVLLGILFFLVLISSFLVVFASALGIFGFNLAAAAIATEDSDTFDGVSRSWNYILARPWQVILTYLAIFAYLGVVLFAGGHFIRLSVQSLTVGWWGLGAEAREPVRLDAGLRQTLQLPEQSELDVVYLPGKGDFLYNTVIGKNYRPDDKGRISYPQGAELALDRFRIHVGRYPTSEEGLRALLENPANYGPDLPAVELARLRKTWSGPYLLTAGVPLDEHGFPYAYRFPSSHRSVLYDLYSVGPDGQIGGGDDRHGVEGVGLGHGPLMDIAPIQEWTLTNFASGAVWFWVSLARLLLAAYVLAYFVSAQTTVYFLLRRDVEGDDYTEITLEDEVEEYEGETFATLPSSSTAPPPPTGTEPRGKPLPTAETDPEES